VADLGPEYNTKIKNHDTIYEFTNLPALNVDEDHVQTWSILLSFHEQLGDCIRVRTEEYGKVAAFIKLYSKCKI